MPTTGDPFGFTPGTQYDLKWPANASVGTLGNNKVPCAGDNNTQMVNRESGASSHLGEIVLNSASALAADITMQDDAVGVSVSIDQSVNPTTGQKNSIVKALNSPRRTGHRQHFAELCELQRQWPAPDNSNRQQWVRQCCGDGVPVKPASHRARIRAVPAVADWELYPEWWF